MALEESIFWWILSPDAQDEYNFIFGDISIGNCYIGSNFQDRFNKYIIELLVDLTWLSPVSSEGISFVEKKYVWFTLTFGSKSSIFWLVYILSTSSARCLVLFGLSGSSIYAYKHLSYCELWRDKFLWFTASLLGVFFLAYQLLSYLSRRIICLSRFLNLSSLQRKLIFLPFLTP